jgi:hypothetical protein
MAWGLRVLLIRSVHSARLLLRSCTYFFSFNSGVAALRTYSAMSSNNTSQKVSPGDGNPPPDLAAYQTLWQEIHKDTVKQIKQINSKDILLSAGRDS